MKITAQSTHTIAVTVAVTLGVAIPAHAGSLAIETTDRAIVLSVTIPATGGDPRGADRGADRGAEPHEIRYDQRDHAYSVPASNAPDDFTGAESVDDRAAPVAPDRSVP